MMRKEIRVLKREEKRKKKKLFDAIGICCAVLIVAACILGVVFAPKPRPGMVMPVSDMEHTGKAVANKVQTMSGVTLLHAADWAEEYPEIYASWQKNQENDEIEDYLQSYPQLVTLYEPYGFSKSYGSARGHFYDVDDILETGRPHKLAQCWTCKTPDFTHYVNEHGPEAYLMDFDKMGEQITEAISCYTCHANTPGEITVTHTYVMDALGEDWDQVSAADLACGQCHVEYYFYPGTGVTSLPRFDLESMHPDAILNYYNKVLVDENGLGFADYTNPRTGVRQIKVQHPEFETFLGKGSIHGSTYTCADCHMGTVYGEKGALKLSDSAGVSFFDIGGAETKMEADEGITGHLQDDISGNMYATEIATVVDCALTGKAPKAGAKEAIEAMTFCQGMIRSAETGEVVRF